ncbi:DNA topoisomerase-1 [Entomoplasma freundtii]|uniref:DNA topoisomerase 1 n=1 Tax=Entomoplasma freundtii TaxID=74700 RepID=A0A2K8NSG7_9MOLU|nr:type I DNA topoisomerase [Entomoplasma freundtii]ATZ16098.1 DNA topoisomerase I [Entomoplasma freundtii]TDY57001.1 DNA topoisomerase-1 [Entomoplasma freundtii]
MAKVLVLLESPSKTKKIQHFLTEGFPENEFTVLASAGHINKIPDRGENGLGIDLETMTPNFVVERGKSKNITEIKKAAKQADMIVLASDPDREGEAIAWHLANLLLDFNKPTKRATFNEITSSAVIEAFKNLTEIDEDLVKAQLSRQMLDKIIGYLVSKALQKNTGLMSAGRVQTPALYLLIARDRLIKAFKEISYHKIKVVEPKRHLNLLLTKDKDQVLVNTEKTYYINDQQAETILNNLGDIYQCIDYKATPYETRSFKPYSTAGLLQDGFSKLHLSAAQITVAAQKLYEAGLITYIRTDSTRYSETFIQEAKTYIETHFKPELYAGLAIQKKDKNAQEAHESIRPTNLAETPEKVMDQLDDEIQKRIYALIWWNTLKSLMHGPRGINHRWTLLNEGYEFKQSWQEVHDDGYQNLVHQKSDEDIELDDNEEEIGQKLRQPKVDLPLEKDFTTTISKDFVQNESAKTMPPKMYNQASLIKELKALGIGRPSTYSPILTKLKEREYVIYHKGKAIEMTEKGYVAEDYLYKGFEEFFNLSYTASMEEKLDEIANGNFDNVKWLKEIYGHLNNKTKEEVAKAQTSDLLCPKCHDGKLVFIKSRYGRGRGCSLFSTNGCSYREYEQPDGSWLEYIAQPKEKKAKKPRKAPTKKNKK